MITYSTSPGPISTKGAAGEMPSEGDDTGVEYIDNLLHVVDDIPIAVWLAALVGAAERFAWYGNTGPLRELALSFMFPKMGHPLQQSPDSAIAGVLGLSQAAASNINSAFLAVSYFTPIPAALLADSWLGRYNGLVIFYIITLVGALILFVAALPRLVHTGAPLGDQYAKRTATVKLLKSGNLAVTDRNLTIRYIYNAFNWLVNVGGLAALGTTFLERYASFWAAYLGPLIVMFFGLIPLTVTVYAVKGGFNMDAAKPGPQLEKHNRNVPWNDFIPFIIYWLCLNQTFYNLISQAGTMIGSGVPNDSIKSLNPMSVLIFTPLVESIIYPFLTRHKITIGPITTITIGFGILSVSQILAAVVQHIIYTSPPCYNFPLSSSCPGSDKGKIPNQVSMFLQVPVYVTGGISEIFAVTTALEFAYNQSPASMRSVIQSYWLSTAGIGSLLILAFTPLAKDPYFVIMHASLAGLMVVTTVAFRILFRSSNVPMDILGV
ncbi:oligopeptide transporter [Rhypophila decipiens]|uniref:Oligopeptide transporter n=1 Tax=Rhypophila decipiens TaxID=261697 RepID=A0AAN7B2I7_9PEZI|nr:oligopeptide transporter [Rhypophila decipiens]